MNIYEMYVANGNKAGFFVQRDSWYMTIARVVSVGGMQSGPLLGDPPYYNNVPVLAEVWGKDGVNRSVLSCPGTEGYRWMVPKEGR